MSESIYKLQIFINDYSVLKSVDFQLFGSLESMGQELVGIMASYEKLGGFFQLNKARLNNIIDEKYTPEEMISELGLNEGEPICDGYFHHRNCTYFVQECKKKNIKRALEQLESSVDQLKKKGHPVHKNFLFLEKLGKRERNIYEISSQGVLLKKDGGSPYFIQGISVNVLDDKTFKVIDEGSWPFI